MSKYTKSVCKCGKPNLGFPFPIKHCNKTVNLEREDSHFSVQDLKRAKKKKS